MRVSRDFGLPRAGSISSVALGLLASTLGCGPDPVPAGTGGGGSPTTGSSSTSATTSSSTTNTGSSTTASTSSGGSGTGGDASSGGGGATSAGGGGAGTGTGGSGPGAGGGGSGPGTGTGGSGGGATTTGSGGAGGAEIPCAGDPDDTPCAGGICCGGACIAANDDANCHACGNTCGALESCGATDCELDCAGSGLTECNGECIDLAEDDPANCGACGRDCLGGTCQGGQCQALVLLNNLQSPQSMADEGSHVYFSERGDGNVDNARTRRFIKATGITENTIPDGWGNAAIGVGGGFLYQSMFHNDGVGAVYRYNLDDVETFVELFAVNNGPLTHPGVNTSHIGVSSTSISFVTLNRVVQCDLSGGICQALAGGTEDYSLADTLADEDRIYWLDHVLGTVWSRPNQQLPNALEANPLVSGQQGAKGLAQTPTHLFWAVPSAGSLGVFRALKGNVPTVATTIIGGVDAHELAVDGDALFWTTMTGELETCSVTNCAGTRRTMATFPGVGGPLVVDGQAVYYLGNINSVASGIFGRVAR